MKKVNKKNTVKEDIKRYTTFEIKKKILAKVKDYKLECDRVYHYFSGKELKDINIGKCWCKK